jgi:glycosyltransferase involved in cell wall biosynthesis
MTQLSIIIPVYNEAESLDELSRRVIDVMVERNFDYEIIFVNDGSSDTSADTLNQLARSNERIKVIHLKRNFGQTAAMMAAFDHSQGEIIIPMDADLQNDPVDIPNLLDQIDQGYDVCSGWRKNRKDNFLTRTFPSRIANWIISTISGVRLNDYGCCLKAIRREFITDVKLYGEMHRFIPIYASWHGARITEIPVMHHPRRHGESHYGLERTLKVILDLIVIKYLARYAEKPIYIFGGFGVLNLCCAVLSGAAMIYYKFWGGKSFVETPLPVLLAIFILIGFGSILGGLLAELVMRTYYETQGKRVYMIESARNLELN